MNTPEVELPAASEFTWTTVDGAVTSVQGEPVVLLCKKIKKSTIRMYNGIYHIDKSIEC